MFYTFGALVTLMLKTTNTRNLIPVGASFLWKLKIFDYIRLSCLLIFVGSITDESFGFFLAFESSCLSFFMVQLILFQGFLSFLHFLQFFNEKAIFSSVFDLSFARASVLAIEN